MRNRIFASLLTIGTLLSTTSCEKWMDVQPATQIKSEVLLQDEQGYKDALIGSYTLMKTQQLYGRELTFGFMDAAILQYDLNSNTTYKDLSQKPLTYTSSGIRSIVDNAWKGMYNVIANVNNILDHIDADKAKFTGNNYQIIKGEALAMRAFIHFDLLRLFGSTDMTKPAIPYVTTLSTNVTPRATGNQVMESVLKDLKDASDNLSVDPIKNGLKRSADMFLDNRHQRLNYYAVKAIAARAYLWKNDKVNALANAMEVINIGNQTFPWILTSNITAINERDRDYTFSTENLFALNVFDLKSTGNTWFYAAFASNQLQKSGAAAGTSGYTQMFETASIGANDIRLLYVTKKVGTTTYIVNKFYQPDNFNTAFAAMMPLIRRSEMNYIAAECNVGVDNQVAINYLNEVRANRGITAALSSTLTSDQIQTEILKEYRKEFQGEGQLFAYCKRTKQTVIPGTPSGGYLGTPITEAQMILPLPDSEVEYGR
ncbi:RagB/SusD family nutrient uptake outer membrane protein [Solitalea lacus]|uniref:RagB/SusD family nutrient uptake outer membrane protein n=1 Tax=Solitalea lacus TaxID=2911172 RepID=UPI001EDB9A03|nr:RagB/SusD family nutrient uptake outer membrane protein [Solitalea lacus]UKJ08578.1 RagB/SusD family nutrient uptake outer membrane protein [Solitalea lacus]